MALATIAAVAAIGGGVLSAMGSKSAADQQRKAIKLQMRLDKMQRTERARQTLRETQYLEGAATAAVGASNIRMSGSAARYVNDMKSEHGRQRAFAEAEGNLAQQVLRAGMPTNSATNMSMASDLLGGVSSAMGAYSMAKSPALGGGTRSDPGLGSDWAGNDPFKSKRSAI